jgi:hydrogenase maturation protease
MRTRTLVAGIGNDLLGDDGFGIAAIRRLAAHGVPDGVRLLESGIAGIGLVQELLDGYDLLIILDAADRGTTPGTLHLLEVEVPETSTLSEARRRELMSDMHWTVPSLALILARALHALPPRVFILGCQPGSMELGMRLSPAVDLAATAAVGRVLALIPPQTVESTPSSDLASDVGEPALGAVGR